MPVASFSANTGNPINNYMGHISRRSAFQNAAAIAASLLFVPQIAHSFSASSQGSVPAQSTLQPKATANNTPTASVAYRPLSLQIPQHGVTVPVAMWFPTANQQDSDTSRLLAKYDHRISVKKIGELLAGWDFIPEFASKDFQLQPTIASVIDGTKLSMPTSGPVVFLAHGYLGSRFDLSHLAEALAQEGFICLSPEFPESLAASFPRLDGLDRSVIMSSLLDRLSSEWGVTGTSFGIIGHSAGCGTATTTGDDTWTRVCIAGSPRRRDGSSIPGSVLLLSSMNDGAVSLARFGGRAAIPSEYALLEESTLSQLPHLPKRSFLLFDRPDAPNHISFLADGTNDAMIGLLSPLLPVAQAMNIPVLDFDKYQASRDSKQTAEIVIPLVTKYLKQEMLKS